MGAVWAARFLVPGSLTRDPPALCELLHRLEREVRDGMAAEGYDRLGVLQWQARPLFTRVMLPGGVVVPVPDGYDDPELGAWVPLQDDGSAMVIVHCEVS